MEMLRIVRGYFRDGMVYLPRGLHSSGVLGSMQGCNCLMEVPAGSEGLRAGDTVSHKTFGQGMILSATPMANDTLLEIAFEKVGTKKLMANFARLEKL